MSMAYAATGVAYPAGTTTPRLLAVQRALVWLVAASSAIVFIEPSPYEVMTLGAALFFCATGLRMRLVLVPLFLLLILINIGYSISAIPLYDKPEVVNSNPHGSWMIAVKLTNPPETAALLEAAQYAELVK